jgi:hypothetical protein
MLLYVAEAAISSSQTAHGIEHQNVHAWSRQRVEGIRLLEEEVESAPSPLDRWGSSTLAWYCAKCRKPRLEWGELQYHLAKE